MTIKKLGENAVFIARMQGFHNAHLNIVRHSLERYDRLIIGIGSARQAPSPKNPWTADERVEMVKRTLTPAELGRVVFMVVCYVFMAKLAQGPHADMTSMTEQGQGPASKSEASE